MRACLFLSTAIALAGLTAAVADGASSSFTVPNDESQLSGYFTLIDRVRLPDGSRICKILDRGETQAFRNLYPLNKRGERSQVILRKTHDEKSHSHHGSSSLLDEEQGEEDARELLELNMNVQSSLWEVERHFLEGECDASEVDDELDHDNEEDKLIEETFGSNDASSLGQTVFGNKMQSGGESAYRLQEGDEVVREPDNPKTPAFCSSRDKRTND